MNTKVAPHSFRAWWLAARPKTLSGALVSVVTATALAYAYDQPHAAAPLVAVLCAVFAALMQIASNFINDLIDFRRGRDGEDRLGPERACAQGWISARAMQWGIAAVLALAALMGIALLVATSFVSQHSTTQLVLWLSLVGLACGAGAFLYTTHLSRYALGDAMVLLFFGLVPVCATYFLLTDHLTLSALLLGLAIGLVVDQLLVINNFRDRDNDARVGKRTLVVLLGEKASLALYLILGVAAIIALYFCCYTAANSVTTLSHPDVSAFVQLLPAYLLVVVFIPFQTLTWQKLYRSRSGRALNALLGETSRNILLFALTFCVGLWIQHLLV